MEVHDLVQGEEAWEVFRLTHFGASEAAAMLGVSKKVKRTELLHMKKTGTAKEFSAWVQKNILDYGHQVEAMARPLVEELIGESLYPVTCSDGTMSASCDGLTMSERIAFEHKQWAEELAASVAAGVLPEEHQPQCQQIMMVTGAEKVVFVVSDGTRDNFVWMEVFPDPEWQKRIRAGWEQFEKDLDDYVPQIAEPEAVGRAPESLPALRIEVTGMVTASNLEQFKAHAMAVFGGIKRDLQTDQDFADAEKTVKWCGDIEDRLKAAKQHALSQTSTIDELFRAIDEIGAEARATRLELEKLVKARKDAIREEIRQAGVQAIAKHIETLNARIGKPYMPAIAADFAGVMKGKKTVASLRDAVDTELARAKIAANEVADRIQINLTTLSEVAADYQFLFADLAQLVLKSGEDFTATAKMRISEHQAKEERRLADERSRIEAEAQEKARREAAAAEAEALRTALPAPTSAPVEPAPAAVTTAAQNVVPISAAAPSTSPTLKLGQIAERLGFALTADFLTSIGFPPAAMEKGAKLYHEADFPRICDALKRHIDGVQHRLAA